jgi:predicted lipoprotein with Yx(FWY)xxD motif
MPGLKREDTRGRRRTGRYRDAGRHRDARRLRGRLLGAALVFMAVAVSLAAVALAAGGAATVSSASSSKLGEQIAVDVHGRTLYALSPETAGHLLCKSSECLKAWPPLTVASRKTKLKAGPGLHGHLGILRRSNGVLQVTLRGLPLYRFSGDQSKGEVNGQGIKSFGGTWHAVTATAGTGAPPAAATEPPGYGAGASTGTGGAGAGGGTGIGGASGSSGTSTPSPTTTAPTTTTPATTTPTTTAPTTTAPTTTTPYEYPKEKASEPGW